MSQAVKVGMFATVCLVILAILIWQIEDINPFAEKGRRIDALFDSVAGLDEKASVRVAGVRVGRVDGVDLEGRKARVTLLLEKPVDMPQGTIARVANLGLLGEKYIEIVPGPPGGAPLPPGTVLPGETPPSIDEAIAKFNEIGDSIQEMTGSLSGADIGGGINRLVDELELTSREIRLLLAENRANLNATIGNFREASAALSRELPRLADQMNRTLVQIESLVADNRGEVSDSLHNIREVTDRLQTSADNFNQISGKIARGEGTVGKLVNDEEAYDKVVSTLDSIQGGVETLSGTLGAINRFRIDLDMQGYVLPGLDDSNSQTALLLDIDPQDEKRLYRAGISVPPGGKRREKTETITVTNPDGTTDVTTVNKITTEKTYAVTGLFGFRAPRDVRLFAGLIESTGGAQVEYPMLKDRFLVSFEAFDFNRPEDLSPHLRLSGRWRFHPNLYVVGGYDDVLEDDSLFLGAGIRWNDENIKYLLGVIPK
ncbi:MAG: phospholipid/cholesterol/gamma-HCH transport system substrate-binding protein [Acidobacteriota bacterium]|jgi:phospholipid/cholesterol/gamma-HCH transport system substrate-binding protein|nr:phospholipid/cholesterol/gamma-HCH transport system substrate-binding protein [Acidobacteriota bacterium]